MGWYCGKRWRKNYQIKETSQKNYPNVPSIYMDVWGKQAEKEMTGLDWGFKERGGGPLRLSTNSEDTLKFNQLNADLAWLLSKEESYRRQWARAHWLKEGDLNIRFFNSKSTSRKKKNRMERITKETLSPLTCFFCV